jgi:hypothetical protein
MLLTTTGCDLFFAYHPRDFDLERPLLQSQPLFDQLIKMADEDPLVARIATDFYKLDTNNGKPIDEPTPRFSKDRWDQYREIFRALGLKSGLMRLPEYPGVVFLLPFYNELKLVDDEGYAYSIQPLAPQKNSLEHPREIRPGFVFKHVKGNWYLFAIGKP